MNRACEYCCNSLPRPKRGRPQRFCSARCQKAATRENAALRPEGTECPKNLQKLLQFNSLQAGKSAPILSI
jgi:hypothetical protein